MWECDWMRQVCVGEGENKHKCDYKIYIVNEGDFQLNALYGQKSRWTNLEDIQIQTNNNKTSG